MWIRCLISILLPLNHIFHHQDHHHQGCGRKRQAWKGNSGHRFISMFFSLFHRPWDTIEGKRSQQQSDTQVNSLDPACRAIKRKDSDTDASSVGIECHWLPLLFESSADNRWDHTFDFIPFLADESLILDSLTVSPYDVTFFLTTSNAIRSSSFEAGKEDVLGDKKSRWSIEAENSMAYGRPTKK